MTQRKWTAADLPAMSGRTVLVTGASSGLGLVTARELIALVGNLALTNVFVNLSPWHPGPVPSSAAVSGPLSPR